MSLSSRKAIFLAMFALPAVCYFIGMGTVLNLAVSSAVDGQKEVGQLDETCQHAVGENQALAAELEAERERVAKLQLQVDDKARQQIAESKRLGEQIVAGAGRLRQAHAQADGIIAGLNDSESLAISLDVLQQKLREAEAELGRLSAERDAAMRDKIRVKPPRVVLEGTVWRPNQPKPVYLVCSAQDAILEPQGRKFGSEPDAVEQQGFLAAARATRYVVFLIRPDGMSCFMLFRRLVISDNATSGRPIQFGFEPVNADWDCSNPG